MRKKKLDYILFKFNCFFIILWWNNYMWLFIIFFVGIWLLFWYDIFLWVLFNELWFFGRGEFLEESEFVGGGILALLEIGIYKV